MTTPPQVDAAPERVESKHDRRVARRLRRIVVILHRMTLPFVRYDIRGGERIRELPSIIIVGNHRSLLDFIVGLYTAHLFGVYPRVLIARRFVESRLTGAFTRWVGAIPVSAGKEGAEALQSGVDALSGGFSTVVMPEGRLHEDRDDRLSLTEGRTGVSRLAVGSGSPVVAAGVLGADRAWRPGRLPNLNPFRRRVVVVRVADDPFHLHGDDHRANTQLVMDAISVQLDLAARDHPELL